MFRRRALPALFLLALTPGALAQTSATPEISSQDAPVIFRSTSNLIPVTVVVRDSQGHTVGNLAVGDFQLFDNGKPQMVSKFTVESLATENEAVTQPAPSKAAASGEPPAQTAAATTPQAAPDRFVAYLFDDLHLSLQDLVATREAAERQIDSAQHARERAAIYTTSGRVAQEFTGDHDKIHSALSAIGAGYAATVRSSQQNSCPQVDYYMGDLIYNKDDATALAIATKDALACLNLPYDPNADITLGAVRICEGPHGESSLCTAVDTAKRTARLAVLDGDKDTESALNVLRSVVGRMTSMPGQRSVVVVSPGFLVLESRHEEEMDVIDRAIKGNVVIGGLDARGLYTQATGGSASDRVANPGTITAKIPYQSAETLTQTDVVASLADGTGGTFYHGTNDYDDGFTRVAAAPAYRYILGFSPPDLKLDGKFHTLKVTLTNRKGVELQVRKGYYAANYAVGPAEQSRQQIEDAFFSRDEIHDLPAVLQTQYFKGDDGDATLSAVAKIDVKQLGFRKEGDRNVDDLTVVTGVFDSDGNYMTGSQKIIQMKLLDRTLETRLGNGISVKNDFAVHPGRYTVRLVVRDSQGQLMSAQSSLVEIP